MTEESLKHLSLDELFALMGKTIDEYLLLDKAQDNKINLETHQSELSNIHKVITQKKADIQHRNLISHPPG